jgi:hypothetical protein
VVAFGEEWMPNHTPSAEALEARIAQLGRLAEEAGRPTPRVSFFGVPARPDVVSAYREAGVKRCILFVPPVARGEAEGRMDRLAKFLEEYRRSE